MRMYLGFKRTVTEKSTGLPKTEVKFVPVEVNGIEAADGWKLIGSSDSVEVITDDSPVMNGEQLTIPGCEDDILIPVGGSFESPVSGTARLVRLKSEIKIAYRKGKKTLNLTSPNSVCIGELEKNQFFADCRRAFGRDCDYYRFSTSDQEYEYWNKFIDDEYNRQRTEVNRQLKTRKTSS